MAPKRERKEKDSFEKLNTTLGKSLKEIKESLDLENINDSIKEGLKDIKEALEKPHLIQYITLIAVVFSVAISMNAYKLARIEIEPNLLFTELYCPKKIEHPSYSEYISFHLINYGTTTEYTLNLTTNGFKCAYGVNSYTLSDSDKYDETNCGVKYGIGANSNADHIFLLLVNGSYPKNVWFNIENIYNKLYGQKQKNNMIYCRYNQVTNQQGYAEYLLVDKRYYPNPPP